ncbi:hypothetical protein [Alistipes putredinis]|uniref:hypothetical protein n=1 Tax=Alistipes putredinis TaxID=28117 RepID=UPI00399367F7
MEFQMIEQSAFDEMKTLVTTLRERAERFRELFSPPQPRRWLTAEEVCKALRITKRTLQYYRSEGDHTQYIIGQQDSVQRIRHRAYSAKQPHRSF